MQEIKPGTPGTCSLGQEPLLRNRIDIVLDVVNRA
jgi:hypothetical protein